MYKTFTYPWTGRGPWLIINAAERAAAWDWGARRSRRCRGARAEDGSRQPRRCGGCSMGCIGNAARCRHDAQEQGNPAGCRRLRPRRPPPYGRIPPPSPAGSSLRDAARVLSAIAVAPRPGAAPGRAGLATGRARRGGRRAPRVPAAGRTGRTRRLPVRHAGLGARTPRPRSRNQRRTAWTRMKCTRTCSARR